MCTGRGRPAAKKAKASVTAAAASAGESTRRLQATIRSKAPPASFVSCSCPASPPSVPRGSPGEMISSGRDSAYAVPAAAATLNNAGPLVVITTPGRPLTW